ncbi:MAG: hypothetical protein R2911_40500 [Caldilineaceae bacterium]
MVVIHHQAADVAQPSGRPFANDVQPKAAPLSSQYPAYEVQHD